MSAIFRKKDFYVFNFIVCANNKTPWVEYKIGHSEDVFGCNYLVSSFYVPKHRALVAVVAKNKNLPKREFSLDCEKESKFLKTYSEAWNAPEESRYNLIIDFLAEQITEYKEKRKGGKIGMI